MYVQFISSFDMDSHYRIDGVEYSVRLGMYDSITREGCRAEVRALVGTVRNRSNAHAPVSPDIVAYFRERTGCADLVGARFAEDWTVILDGPRPVTRANYGGTILVSWDDRVHAVVHGAK